MENPIQIISAPSILGLKPSGVQYLGKSLLKKGLADRLYSTLPIVGVPTLNDQYSFIRDEMTDCLNPLPLRDFSIRLCEQLEAELRNENFKLVLGGDCTILLGIMPALKAKGEYGLLYLDAHADFYQPDKSTTGEVADMGLAMVTGRGPEVLTNINNLKPYVRDENVIHIGQRDAEEAKSYGSQDIKTTSIKCFDLNKIRIDGLESISDEIIALTANVPVEGFWLHFDTDVISDDENPAVDYRLPGGLTFEETSKLLTRLLLTDKIVGMSVTIFNPQLDHDGEIAEKITACLSNSIIAARL